MLRSKVILTGVLAFAFGVFCQSLGAAEKQSEPVRALLVIGGCCHDYLHQKNILTDGISARANVQWTIAYDTDDTGKRLNPIFKNPDWAKGYDVIVHDECSAEVKDLAEVERVLKPHREGVPAVVLHCAMHSYRTEGWKAGVTPWFELTGLPTTSHGPQAPIAVTYATRQQPILQGLKNWSTINEEHYNNSIGKLLPTAESLADGEQSYRPRDGKQVTNRFVVAWTNTYQGKTRVFGTTLGHQNATVASPEYLDLVTRGLLWTVNRLDDEHLRPADRVLLEKPAEQATH